MILKLSWFFKYYAELKTNWKAAQDSCNEDQGKKNTYKDDFF